MLRRLLCMLPGAAVAWLQVNGALGGASAPANGAVVGAPQAFDLSAAAQASGRPHECASAAASGASVNAWDAARDWRVQRYCELLARGLSQLSSQPESARVRADQADDELPGRAAPWVLRARASVLLREPVQAVQEFARARSLDPRSLDDPFTSRSWARALSASGQVDDAIVAYRALVPQLSAFSLEERAATLLDGAEVAAQVGPAAAPDGIAWLREAHRSGPRELARRVAAFLALSLDRAGAGDEAAAVMVGLGRRGGKISDADPAALRPEQVASAAFAAERVDVRAARLGWQRYLAMIPGDAPYRAHAEKRLSALRRGAR